MAKYILMSILTEKRSNEAVNIQNVLTKHGCIIKMRLGLHEVENVCSEEGLIILLLSGEKKDINLLEKDLKKIKNVKVNYMDIK